MGREAMPRNLHKRDGIHPTHNPSVRTQKKQTNKPLDLAPVRASTNQVNQGNFHNQTIRCCCSFVLRRGVRRLFPFDIFHSIPCLNLSCYANLTSPLFLEFWSSSASQSPPLLWMLEPLLIDLLPDTWATAKPLEVQNNDTPFGPSIRCGWGLKLAYLEMWYTGLSKFQMGGSTSVRTLSLMDSE